MEKGKSALRVVGVMSGSSLDGIDLALCRFRHAADGAWAFHLEAARTVAYAPSLRHRLLSATRADALELARLHRDVGQAIGQACKALLQDHPADLIASHGHTIFHQPDEGLTVQVGSGARIAALSNLPTVCDFRSMDVALGGQGAPLVPLGERLLFPGHRAFVNLGGIANVAFHHAHRSIGYDICPCNQPLNMLAAEVGLPYDEGGLLAASGQVVPPLLARLDALEFYRQAPPRSLGREWFEEQLLPLLDPALPVADRLRTVTEHIAGLIAGALAHSGERTALFTGGGAHNHFLMERIASRGTVRPERPAAALIDYKEAVIFALLGLLRWRGEPNVLASVTGSARNNVGGAVYLPN